MTWLTVALLVVAGGVLLVAELFLPGGVVGVAGFLCLLVAIVQAYYLGGPFAAAAIAVASAVGIGIGAYFWFKYFPQSAYGKRIIPQDTNRDDDSRERYADLIGQEGEIVAPCRPVGEARINGKRYDVVSQGQVLDNGVRVRVRKTSGTRIEVEAVDGN